MLLCSALGKLVGDLVFRLVLNTCSILVNTCQIREDHLFIQFLQYIAYLVQGPREISGTRRGTHVQGPGLSQGSYPHTFPNF